MKAQLMFNLEDEDDKLKFQEIASENHTNLKCAAHDFSENVLRRYRKYGIPLREIFDSEEQLPTDPHLLLETFIQHIEKKFHETLENYEAKIS